MGWLDTTRIDSLTWATAAALATAQLYPRDTAGYVPVLAEVICWTLLAVFFTLLPRFRLGNWQDDNVVSTASLTLRYWAVAASIAATTASFSVQDSLWVAVSFSSLSSMQHTLTMHDSP
jgi:hypothetical protein